MMKKNLSLLKQLGPGLMGGPSWTPALHSTLAMRLLFPGHRFNLMTCVTKDLYADLITNYQTKNRLG